MTKTTLVIGIAVAAVAIAALCLFFLGGAGGASGEGSEKLTAPGDTVRYIVKIDGEITYDEKSPMHDGMFQIITYVPSWSGHAFTGWNDKEDGTGKSYRSGETVMLLDMHNKGIVLYAQWSK
ncbi:MAG: InlB B-repeat-containing protein [Candidatus Methanoplasma sp.]|jgi:hypothetical protein|nr:InlB B-repeat-containing protein [Candidatus Methanoplasma sp.]